MNDEERVISCQKESRRLHSVVRAYDEERAMLLKYLQDRIDREEVSSDVRQAFHEIYTFITQE